MQDTFIPKMRILRQACLKRIMSGTWQVRCNVAYWKSLSGIYLPRQVTECSIVAGRVGEPTDIAELCLFLADNERAKFITGQHFTVDGGVTAKLTYPEQFQRKRADFSDCSCWPWRPSPPKCMNLQCEVWLVFLYQASKSSIPTRSNFCLHMLLHSRQIRHRSNGYLTFWRCSADALYCWAAWARSVLATSKWDSAVLFSCLAWTCHFLEKDSLTPATKLIIMCLLCIMGKLDILISFTTSKQSHTETALVLAGVLKFRRD